MGLKDDLTASVRSTFRSQWTTRDGTKVPDEDSKLGLTNEAIKIDGTVLYADLADSTKMVDSEKAHFAAEIYKTFLHCAAQIIRDNGGVVAAYDGDRVMAVYIGAYKNTNAAKTALKIKWAVDEIITPQLRDMYKTSHATHVVGHVTGIDTSGLFVAKTGVRGANDLVWVGRAANYAAKLSSLPASYTYITKAVYDALAPEAKTSDGKSMWEAKTWNTFDNSIIYRSSYRWALV